MAYTPLKSATRISGTELAVMETLASQSHWLKLGHYARPPMSASGWISYVDDPRFFLSPEGKTNPLAELQATFEGLYADPALGNEHPACRFPARRDWLLQQGAITAEQLPQPECTDYRTWRDSVNATRVSLIFPSAYINSPSSMFGHTLFRFDPANLEERTDWLSWSLSFGANMDPSDNSVAFAYKGIFGGYDGLYTMLYYFEKIKEYNHLENRDIWEYALDITPEQVDTMLAHTWELKDIRFDYYFLDENCAFRLLELIELVRSDVNLTGRFGFTAIPADTVRAFIDEGLVTDVQFKPSAATELNSRIQALTPAEADLARQLSDDLQILESAPYQSLQPERQAEVIQVAYSYLRYRQLKIVRDPELAERSHRLLAALNRLPSSRHRVTIPARPEAGHRTRMVGLSGGANGDQAYAQLDFRVTYHDLLDNPAGYPTGAQIAMGNTELRWNEEADLQLQRFDFIDIVSLSDRDRFFDPISWHVKTGYEQIRTQTGGATGEDTGAYYVQAGGGATWPISPSSKLFTFADARLENNSRYKAFLTPAAGVSGGFLRYSTWGTFRSSVDSDYFVNDDYRVTLQFEQNVVITAQSAVRLSARRTWFREDHDDEWRIAYRHHF